MVVLPPGEAGNFVLAVTYKRRIRIDDLEKEFGFSRGKDFKPHLTGRLQEKFIVLAKEGENQIGILGKSILTHELIERFGIDFDLDGPRLLSFRPNQPGRRTKSGPEGNQTARKNQVKSALHEFLQNNLFWTHRIPIDGHNT